MTNYKGKIDDAEFEDWMKEMLLKKSSAKTQLAVETVIESSDCIPEEEIDHAKEREVIAKLKDKTGIAGLGLAGTSMVTLLLLGLNMM